ncbi:MAG: DNA polymerase III subunit gamma/tau [Thermodesulfovibrionales bacterium]|jgi:DNA polymerase-3 subunit gamma/tau
MSYLVLARKWRPQGFQDLIGQEPINRILSNALSQGKIAHAYLFSGPRGVGKTSTARILAKALNCEKGPTPSPCGTCVSCRGIVDGSSIDVLEIDGASNNSVNDIRDLRERVKYAPVGGRYKVYIIDEAHMLSDSAFNALLKTLEEPPSHVIFVLATTSARKIPATVLSRCQHLSFRRVPIQKIKERLRSISDSEGIRISDPAIDMIARAADGSMRDSLTILDQVSAFASDIEESEIKDLLGVVDFRVLSELSAAVIGGERKKILDIIAGLADTGTDFKSFVKDLMNFSRDLLVAKVVENPQEVFDISDHELRAVREILRTPSEDYLTVLLSEMIKAESDVRFASSPRIALEMALIKASFLSTLRPVKEAIENIQTFITNQKGPSAKEGEIPDLSVKAQPTEEVTRKEGEKRLPRAPESLGTPSVTDATGEREGTHAEKPPGKGSDAVSHTSDKGDFRDRFIQRIEVVNHPLACRLSEADARMDGETLTLIFNGGMAIHADSAKKNQQVLEEIASEIEGRKISVRIDIVKKKTPRKKDLKEKLLSEPLVKEAIELFDGRIVDIKSREHGGRDV